MSKRVPFLIVDENPTMVESEEYNLRLKAF